MKQKTVQVEHAHVRIESTESGLTKVSVFENWGFTRKEPNWTFFVPQSTRSHFGFVPQEIIKSRMKHDFNVDLISYSTTLYK